MSSIFNPFKLTEFLGRYSLPPLKPRRPRRGPKWLGAGNSGYSGGGDNNLYQPSTECGLWVGLGSDTICNDPATNGPRPGPTGRRGYSWMDVRDDMLSPQTNTGSNPRTLSSLVRDPGTSQMVTHPSTTPEQARLTLEFF